MISAGARLGPYEIEAPLGAGGMGEVYKARDTRLQRTVAVKVLPSNRSSSPEMRQRFEREARTISQLSHPHICALYDVGTQDGVEYLVMEYLEGETLAERLQKGPLPPGLVLRYGVEIADALARAHRQGIVHRDLKPGNVMLTKSGVKLLDFGLARAMAPAAPTGTLADPSTREKPLTVEGTLLGTIAYMAPEQLEGREADTRSDIFAFGATLYEMTTGRKAFSGTSQASLMSAILSSEPAPIASTSPTSPPALDRVVRACLAKDPEDRWQSAGDVGKELKWIADGSNAVELGPVGARRRPPLLLAWTIAVAAVLGAVAALLSRWTKPAEELVRFAIAAPAGQTFVDNVQLAPDGRRILLLLRDPAGTTSIWVHTLDALGARRLAGTEKAHNPFWSPEGREIAFFSDFKLRRIAADGGPPQAVCDSGYGTSIGAWSRQGTILFTMEFGTPIVAVPAGGGTPHPVTSLDAERGDSSHDAPSFLPDGRHFVFVARHVDPDKTEIRLGSLDAKEVKPLFHADSNAIYAGTGHLLFARDNALFAWRFDPDRLRLVGEAVPVLEGVRFGTDNNRLTLSAAGDRLAYLSWSLRRRLVWIDRKGRELGSLGGIRGYEDVRISPEGGRLATSIRDSAHGQNLDIWAFDVGRGTATRVTTDRADDFNPSWFPDGKRLAYASDRSGSYGLYEAPATGGSAKLLFRDQHDAILPTITPDGHSLTYLVLFGAQSGHFLRPLSGEGEARRLSGGSGFPVGNLEISPDGRWSAFSSEESGQPEVYVQSVAEGAKFQVSVGGGEAPIWRRDGSELFFMAKDGMLTAVPVRLRSDHPLIGDPQPLFPAQYVVSGPAAVQRPYDVAPDGQRFLIIRGAPDAEPDDAVVVMHWTALLKAGR